MDDLEKQEELKKSADTEEQEEVQETVQEAEELKESAEAETEKAEETEETEEAAEEEQTEAAAETEEAKTEEAGSAPAQEQKQPQKESNLLQILLGFAVMAAFLAFCWTADLGIVKKLPDNGVLYAKDNDLYIYDEKTESYLLQEDLSAGGEYNYFYSAWGAEIVDSGKYAYYPANIDETGSFTLYRKTLAEGASEGDWIADNVYAYLASENGETAAYLTAEGENLILHLYDGESAWVVAEGLHLQEDVFTLSKDGKYLIYVDAYGMLCLTPCNMPMESIKLTDDVQMYALAEDMLYFVAPGEESYCIYSYDFKGEPTVAAENVAYMELMPNGRDLLYSCVSAEQIPYADLIEDDMTEADAALQEGDEGYEAKALRDEIREAMANGEGMEPLLQECYVMTGGKSVKVADNVISAVSVDCERAYAAGYRMEETAKIPLSTVEGGLDMVQYLYYMSLMYGEQQTFLADTRGNCEILTGYGIQPDSIRVSADGSHAAYLVQEPVTGESILMYMEIGKAEEAEAVQMGVESLDFLGGSDQLGYYYNYENNKGTLETVGPAHTMLSEIAAGVQYAPDREEVYFIQFAEDQTETGTLCCWKEDEFVTIDEDVFAFFYHGNGKVVYLKEYDAEKQKGNLFFFDGTNTHLVDTDMTAIFR